MIDILSYKLGQKAGGGSGGGADWNASEGEAGYVKNRTHYEDKAFEPIVWDGNGEYEEITSEDDVFYKIADYSAFSPEQVASVTIKMDADGELTEMTFALEELGGVFVEEHGWEAMQGVLYGSDGQQDFGDIVFPEGVWFTSMGVYKYLAINPATTVKPLDEKYLPDTVATKADIFGAMEASY